MYIKPSKKIQQHHTALLLTTNIINKLIVELLFRKSVVVCVVDGECDRGGGLVVFLLIKAISLGRCGSLLRVDVCYSHTPKTVKI